MYAHHRVIEPQGLKPKWANSGKLLRSLKMRDKIQSRDYCFIAIHVLPPYLVMVMHQLHN